MNIIIAGLGEVGRHVSGTLSREGHHLTLIDSNHDSIEQAKNDFDALTIEGPAEAPSVLRQARVADAGLFAALTSDPAVNLIAALHAKRMGAKRTVARVSESHYFDDQRGVYTGYMDLDLVVNGRFVVARELQRLVRAHAATQIEALAHHAVEMVQLQVDEDGPGVNKPLADLDLPDGARIAAIMRRDTLLIPNTTDMVQVGDAVVVVARTAAIPAVERLFARERHRYVRRAVIIGGGGIGGTLAERLEKEGTKVVVVEKDKAQCDLLSQRLEKTQILHGDGTDVELLESEGIESADVFCAVSGLDEVNLMAGLLAHGLGVRRCITLVRKPDYVAVCRRLGLENSISPRQLVGREILKQLHEDDLVHDVDVLDKQGRVLEIYLSPESPAVGRQLRDLGLPRGAIVCVAVSGYEVRVPEPDSTFAPCDRLIIFAQKDAIVAVGRVFNVEVSAVG